MTTSNQPIPGFNVHVDDTTDVATYKCQHPSCTFKIVERHGTAIAQALTTIAILKTHQERHVCTCGHRWVIHEPPTDGVTGMCGHHTDDHHDCTCLWYTPTTDEEHTEQVFRDTHKALEAVRTTAHSIRASMSDDETLGLPIGDDDEC